MSTNPYIPSPEQALAWQTGFLRGFANSSTSFDPTPEISEYATEAYQQGVNAGLNGAAIGIGSDNCVDAGVEPLDTIDVAQLAYTGGDLLKGLYDAYKLKNLGAGLFAVILFAIDIGTSATAIPAAEPLIGDAASNLLANLDAAGVGSLEIFVGIGIDVNQPGCEFILSAVFPSLDQARTAAQSLGRPGWMTVSWRTDQSHSFRIIDATV